MSRYAIIDTATTGLDPTDGHRVKELAFISVDDSFEKTGDRFETIVDPERDFDLRHIDGITPVHMIGARPFRDYAWQIAQALDGHILVAHGLAFHAKFISTELRLAGIDHDVGHGVCTLQLARASGWPLSRWEAMAYNGIGWEGEKGQSMPEAIGCLELARAGDSIGAALGGTPFTLRSVPPPDVPAVVPHLRSRVDRAVDVVDHARTQLTSIPDAGSDELNFYLYVLSMHVADRAVDAGEWQDLDRLRVRLEISEDQARSAHTQYVEHVIDKAASDGTIAEDEWAHIKAIGTQLGLAEGAVEAMISAVRNG